VTVVTFLFTAVAIVFVQLLLSAIVVVPIVINHLWLSEWASLFLDLARRPILFILRTMMLSFLYRYGPNHAIPRRRWLSWGSVVATMAWLALSIAFSWYVAHFGGYNRTYGSLGAIVGFMTWIWLSIIVILVGAELDAKMRPLIDRQRDNEPAEIAPGSARGSLI
jgi:membrane protein